MSEVDSESKIIQARIRARFPRPCYADDGLLANEAADRLDALEGLLREAMSAIDVICGPDERGRDVVPNLWERITAALEGK